MIDYPIPVMGFCAFSGTGKTTLLAQLIPLLKASGIRLGVVKHAHHDFDIDHPGKDSHRLRSAGADQMLIASRRRIAWIEESTASEEEPQLHDALAALDPDRLDLVLVEGFKREPYPKIELHRASLGKPLLHPSDPTVMAIASDTPLIAHAPSLPQLDLNDPQMIGRFVREWIVQYHTRRREPLNRLQAIR
jgi:molybdopterin-guanine dinucleotide biosynthesis protein B